jgi:hypothetical protein
VVQSSSHSILGVTHTSELRKIKVTLVNTAKGSEPKTFLCHWGKM